MNAITKLSNAIKRHGCRTHNARKDLKKVQNETHEIKVNSSHKVIHSKIS